MSRLTGRGLTWFFLFVWVFVLFLWVWSTGWRTYFIMEDCPVLLLMILLLLFFCWMKSRHRIYFSYPRVQIIL